MLSIGIEVFVATLILPLNIKLEQVGKPYWFYQYKCLSCSAVRIRPVYSYGHG